MTLEGLLQEAHTRRDAPALRVGLGAGADLDRYVGPVPARTFVVASKRALGSTPAAAALVRAGARHYSRVGPNPTTGQALELASAIEEARPEFVLAVGGGSTIDLAKAGRLLTPSPRALCYALQGHRGAFRTDPPNLVAVPTTAGTGSEITPFATLYHQGRKVSVDRSECRPDLAVLDGMLLRNSPMTVAVPSLLDAMCHAIESYWSLAATVRSRRYARVATVALSKSATAHESRADLPDAEAQERLLASALAGLAIAETRTTAVHGFSYALTARHGIPHGFACALSLAWLRRYNWEFRSLGRPGVARVLQELGCHPQADSGAPISIVLSILERARMQGLFAVPDLSRRARAAYATDGLNQVTRTGNHPVPLAAPAVLRYVNAPDAFSCATTLSISATQGIQSPTT